MNVKKTQVPLFEVIQSLSRIWMTENSRIKYIYIFHVLMFQFNLLTNDE